MDVEHETFELLAFTMLSWELDEQATCRVLEGQASGWLRTHWGEMCRYLTSSLAMLSLSNKWPCA